MTLKLLPFLFLLGSLSLGAWASNNGNRDRPAEELCKIYLQIVGAGSVRERGPSDSYAAKMAAFLTHSSAKKGFRAVWRELTDVRFRIALNDVAALAPDFASAARGGVIPQWVAGRSMVRALSGAKAASDFPIAAARRDAYIENLFPVDDIFHQTLQSHYLQKMPLAEVPSPGIRATAKRFYTPLFGYGGDLWLRQVAFRREGNRIVCLPIEKARPGDSPMLIYSVGFIEDGRAIAPQGLTEDWPIFVEYLDQLWDDTVSTRNPETAMRNIAEFEWLYVGANPQGRSGAGMGDILSMVLQKEKTIPPRDQFERLDLEVFITDRERYIEQRVKQFQSRPRP